MSSGGDKSGAEQGIQQAGEQAYARSEQTPQEKAQYTGSFDLGTLLQQIMQYQAGVGGKPSGYQDPTQQYLQQSGALGQALYGQTLQSTQDPYAFYESTLQPQLQLTEDYINKQAQQRGLLRSGIPIEQMGRAGVELAIQEANARMNYRNQALQQGAGLTQYIGQQGQTNLANLGNLYGQQQQFGLQSMGRQAGAAQNAAQYMAYPYQAQLGDYYSKPTMGQGIGQGAMSGAAAGSAFGPWGTVIGGIGGGIYGATQSR